MIVLLLFLTILVLRLWTTVTAVIVIMILWSCCCCCYFPPKDTVCLQNWNRNQLIVLAVDSSQIPHLCRLLSSSPPRVMTVFMKLFLNENPKWNKKSHITLLWLLWGYSFTPHILFSTSPPNHMPHIYICCLLYFSPNNERRTVAGTSRICCWCYSLCCPLLWFSTLCCEFVEGWRGVKVQLSWVNHERFILPSKKSSEKWF